MVFTLAAGQRVGEAAGPEAGSRGALQVWWPSVQMMGSKEPATLGSRRTAWARAMPCPMAWHRPRAEPHLVCSSCSPLHNCCLSRSPAHEGLPTCKVCLGACYMVYCDHKAVA